MKPSTRRLGRGLGAFLDFGPAGQEASAYLPGAAGDEAQSVLETSTQHPTAAADRPVTAPAPAPRTALAPAPAQVPVRVAPPLATPPTPVVRRVTPEPAQAPRDDTRDAPFFDEIVGGLTFPDVDLE